MEDKKVSVRVSKEFLTNVLHEDSNVVSCIYYNVYKDWVGFESSIRIRDCYKQVNIEMDAQDEEDYLNKVEKISALINHLVDFKMDYINGWSRYQNDIRIRGMFVKQEEDGDGE